MTPGIPPGVHVNTSVLNGIPFPTSRVQLFAADLYTAFLQLTQVTSQNIHSLQDQYELLVLDVHYPWCVRCRYAQRGITELGRQLRRLRDKGKVCTSPTVMVTRNALDCG
jgi:hypothetical protein